MNNHLVSVYVFGGAIKHVQSTNGSEWGRDVQEFDSSGVEVPLQRVDITIEPTPEEIAEAINDRPRHRSASALFRDQLEFVGGVVRYRVGLNIPGAIAGRIPDVAPV